APADAQPAGTPRGIATIPAVILLPVLVALGYFWLQDSGAFRLYVFSQPITPTLTLTFLPLFQLALAVVLAFGLWTYAGVRLVHAVVVIALLEVLAFSVSYAYQLALSYILTSREFPALVAVNAI